jgi:polyhydroxyalkanoate synthesis regulator phasin
VGPRFNNANQPKSTFHQHQENALSSWMQITNQRMTVATPVPGPTVINPANGLRIGIFGDNVLAQNGDALMYNQENRHLIFSTNHATPGNILTTDERMRISSLSAPTENPSGGFSAGGYNPGGILFADATRVGLSYLPALPVTAPLSLVHMGGNTSATNDGWRNWMDIGTFVHLPTIGGVPGGHFYSGMRFAGTATGLTAPRDAIINWGFSPPTAVSPGNRLRFIFTTTAGGPFLSSGANGLEAGHFVSDGNNPRFGVGIFSGAGVDPLNTLEIMSSASSPYFASANGSSGLKFRNMNSLVTPVVNPGQGVLALDNAGNVIYVNSSSSSTGCCLGNPCIGAPNPLPGNWSIPMNANNFFFLGNGGPGQDRVGIGFGFCNPPPQARLHVMQNSGVNNDVGILSDNSCTDAIALRARAGGSATGPQTKVAGWFEASGAAGAAQVAIYVPQGSGLVNIGYPTPSSVGAGGGLLNVNGNGAFNGDVFPVIDCNPAQRCGNPTNRWFEVWSCNGAIQTSDERLKENMKPLSYGMEQIMKLKPISYTWKGNAGYGTKIGFVAQQLKEVIGEVVKEGDDPNKTLGVNYAELVPVLIKGMQEQQVQIEAKSQQNDDLKKLIESQQKQIDELRNMITSCCSNANPAANNKAVAQINVELKDGDAVVLNQNVPNPFAEQTVISYNIPEKIQSAQIIFYNNLGQVLKTIDIKTRGKGQLNVYANDLTNGLYSYSLIVDGKIADTKKMIRQN